MLSFVAIAVALVGLVEMTLGAERPEKMPSSEPPFPGANLSQKEMADFLEKQRLTRLEEEIKRQVDEIAWDRQESLVHWMKGLAEILIVIVLAMGTSIWAGKGSSAAADEIRAGLRTCQADLENRGNELKACQTAAQAAQGRPRGWKRRWRG
jgi:outer membrane murein-binding lipoprotein Lpp